MSQVHSGSLFAVKNSNTAVLSDELGTGTVSLFSPTGCSKVGGLVDGTSVTVLGNSGFTGYVLVMTARGEVFEVWHENIKYLSPRGSNFKLN